ncbi:MAG: hypothetical protein PWP67_2308, partial [Clostridium butyricum]|nr:hypothetical protein [Clostridium butyricum]
FKTMEWDDTFKYVADKFIEIKEKYGSKVYKMKKIYSIIVNKAYKYV